LRAKAAERLRISRPSRVILHCRLACGKRHRERRRRSLRHHPPLHDCRGWHVHASTRPNDQAGCRWSDLGRRADHPSLSDLVDRQRASDGGHRSCVHECPAFHRGDCTWHGPVHIADWPCRIRHADAADVDGPHVVLTGLVGRHVGIARTKREPRDRIAVRLVVPAGAVDENDERGRVDRPLHACSGTPAPDAGHVHPATVMRGREPPRLVIHPGPSPGLGPDPTALAVRGPVGSDAWHPDRTVLVHVAPGAEVVKIAVPDRAWRNVASRGALLRRPIPPAAPVLPLVSPSHARHVHARVVEAQQA
jgi:hypothetical protein